MRILIVDDDNKILDYLTAIIHEEYPDWIIDHSTDFKEAYNMAINNLYNFFILDYELDKTNLKKNGLTLGQKLMELPQYHYTPFVFETSYTQHIYPALNNLNCIYYLIKPYDDDDVKDMIKKITSTQISSTRLTFQNKKNICYKLNISDILYVISMRHTLTLFSIYDEYTCTNYSLDSLEKESSHLLVRCHRSYLINPTFIHHVDRTKNRIYIKNRLDKFMTIPVGRKYINLLDELK